MSDFGLKQPRAKRPKRVETPPVAPPSAMAADGRDVVARRAEAMEALVRAAGRGMPKKLCAWAAGVTPRTLRNWLSDGREPYATFAMRWHQAFGERAGELIDAVALTRPEYLLTHVYKLRPPADRVESRDTTEDITRLTEAELDARLAEMGYTRAQERNDDKKAIAATGSETRRISRGADADED